MNVMMLNKCILPRTSYQPRNKGKKLHYMALTKKEELYYHVGRNKTP